LTANPNISNPLRPCFHLQYHFSRGLYLPAHSYAKLLVSLERRDSVADPNPSLKCYIELAISLW
jgi:hypothetical protein